MRRGESAGEKEKKPLSLREPPRSQPNVPPPPVVPPTPPNKQARLSSGAVTLERTKAWLSAAVEGFLGVDAGEGGTGDEAERSRRVKGIRDGREVHVWY